nr:phosphoenolpyruvate carboxykinase (GTP) [Nitrososphaeria archaeon]
LKWMELRVNDDVSAIKTPTGLIPKYEDLKRLFSKTLNKEYTEKQYYEQFTVRIPENLAKIERIIEIYRVRVFDTPSIVFKILEEQKKRLEEMATRNGDYVRPNHIGG